MLVVQNLKNVDLFCSFWIFILFLFKLFIPTDMQMKVSLFAGSVLAFCARTNTTECGSPSCAGVLLSDFTTDRTVEFAGLCRVCDPLLLPYHLRSLYYRGW